LPDLTWEAGEGEEVVVGVGEVLRGGRELGLDGGHDPFELGPDGVGVGLVEHGADEGGDPRLRGFRDLREEVP
jgi:hypothetical protein